MEEEPFLEEIFNKMSNKTKGSASERELLKLFWEKNWACMRTAGSGCVPEPSCDLIVGNAAKGVKAAIECKSSKSKTKYLDKEQISNFLIFCEIFGLKPILAIRFNREGWRLIDLTETGLKDSGKFWVVDINFAKEKGKTFEEFIR